MKNKKSLGQHWLKNRAILDEIAELASGTHNIEAESHDKPSATHDQELCLEIGPGLGTLTSSLLKRFHQVIAVEFDADLARKLPGQFPGKNLTVVHDDILQTDIAEILTLGDGTNPETPYVVAGNIPYYITQPIVRKFLQVNPRPQRLVFLMQKEVAERLAAEPGKLSLFGVMVQNLAEVFLGPVVLAAEFTPPPKVDSQVLILEPRSEPVLTDAALNLAKRGFTNPRKKLVSNLADANISKEKWQDILASIDLGPNVRAEELDLIDWNELASASNA